MNAEVWVAIAVPSAVWVATVGVAWQRITSLSERQDERINRVREQRKEDRETVARIDDRVRDLEARMERLMGERGCGR